MIGAEVPKVEEFSSVVGSRDSMLGTNPGLTCVAVRKSRPPESGNLIDAENG
ncbi:MAG: hypothetical protein GWP06_19550 [Actinobacteria bacterium]|nr:hypothetical protein [Actinomycetota bacterium]